MNRRDRHRSGSPIRALGLLAAAMLATALVRALVEPPLRSVGRLLATDQPWSSIPLGSLVAAGCAVALTACWVWLVVSAVLVAADVRVRGCPRVVRTLVLACLGIAVGVTPAYADLDAGSSPGVTGLSLPDRVATASGRVARSTRVRPGDSLWAIAARHLPAHAPDAAVARGWRLVAAANADRLGADPDLIFPGTVLRVPSLGTSSDTPRKESS